MAPRIICCIVAAVGGMLASCLACGNVPEVARNTEWPHQLREVIRLDTRKPVTALACSPDGKALVQAGEKNRVVVWEISTGKERMVLAGHRGRVWSAAWSPNGKLLASGGEDETVRLYDAGIGKERHVLRGHFDEVRCVRFSPDGQTLASAGQDCSVRLWDVATGKPVREWKAHASWVQALAFAPDGKTLLSGGRDQTARLWDVATGKQLRAFPSSESQVWAVAITPNGRTVATAGGDGAIRLWDVATGKARKPLNAHTGSIWTLAFSSDGHLLASGGQDCYLSLWETATGQKVVQSLRSVDDIITAAFAPDGKTVASGGGDSARVWDLTGCGRNEREGKRFTDQEMQDGYRALGGGHAGIAYGVGWKLSQLPEQTVPFLKQHLRPVPHVEAAVVAKMVADLDSETFATRQKAVRDLDGLGELAEEALREALKNKPSLELTRRLNELLAPLEAQTPSAERLRALRALPILERAGTDEARQVLETLAKGAPGASLTREAAAALARLGKPPLKP